jgi:hypothetical protein
MDFLSLVLEKTLLRQRLSIRVFYNIPLCFDSGNQWSQQNTPIQYNYSTMDQFKRNKNRFMVTVRYRFMGGRSIRQYEKEMANEK